MLRANPQGLLERRDGLLEAVGVVKSAAGEVPGLRVPLVQALRRRVEALRAVPLFARGTDAGRQYVRLGVTVVELDAAFGFVEGGLQLVEVQQRAAQEHTDIGTVGVQSQVLAIKSDSLVGAERAVGGVGLRQ